MLEMICLPYPFLDPSRVVLGLMHNLDLLQVVLELINILDFSRVVLELINNLYLLWVVLEFIYILTLSRVVPKPFETTSPVGPFRN